MNLKRMFLVTICFMGLLFYLHKVSAVLPPSEEPMTKKLTLLPPPSSWGRNIAGSSGEFFYNERSKGSLTGKIEIRNISPNHEYVLTLNGIPGRPGNEHLLEIVGKERYYDFQRLITDSKGNATVNISLDLAPGKYEVKFFVKDPTDWKIVLYNNLLSFIVE